MKQIFSFFWNRIISSASLVNKLMRDQIVDQKEVITLVGKGLFYCQIREGKDGARYVVFKSKGGDATVWNGVSVAEVQSLISFLQQNISTTSATEVGNEEGKESPLWP